MPGFGGTLSFVQIDAGPTEEEKPENSGARPWKRTGIGGGEES